MSERYSQAGPSRSAPAPQEGHRPAPSASRPQAPISAAPVDAEELELSEMPQPPRRALLPADTAEPPRRPSEPGEAWMQDALRSLPPAAERDAMRHQKRSSIASLGPGSRPAQERSHDADPKQRLERIRSAASFVSRVSADRSSQSSKDKDHGPGWISRFTRAAGRSGGLSAARGDNGLSSPVLPSAGDHLLSISKTKAARKQARRDARRARRASERQEQQQQQQRRNHDDGRDDDDAIITLDGLDEDERPSEQQQLRLTSSRSRRAVKIDAQAVDLPIAPPLDVPEANAPTATALAEAAKAARKPKRKLQFAPEQRRVRKVDLPEGYEAGELYRGLDEYVEAARERRRKQQNASSRRSRRRRAGRSSRGSRGGSRSSAASSRTSDSSSSSSSSSSDDGSSSSSSSSSGSGHGLTIARLRAFFGDSSSSSSSSSSDSDSDSDSSSTDSSSTSDGPSSSADRSNARRRRPRSRTFSMSRGSRSKRQGRSRSRGADSEDSDSDVDSQGSSRGGPLTPYLGPLADLQLVRKSRTRKQRKRARNAAKRAKKREAQLIKEGRLPPKPSRSARAKAARARDMAGGVTEYQLFTPMALPMDALSAQLDTQERTPRSRTTTAGVVYRKTMRTTSWEAVRHQFHVLRHYLKQVDGQGGDLGMPASGGRASEKSNTATTSGNDRAGAGRDETGKPASSAVERSLALELSPLQLGETDFIGGDLSLPPPAMDLPEPSETPSPQTGHIDGSDQETPKLKPHNVSSLLASNSRRSSDFEPPGDQEMEGRTGVRMSDLPLSPHMSNDFAKDFNKGFGRSPRSFPPLPSRRGNAPFDDDDAEASGGPGRRAGKRNGGTRPRTARQQKYKGLFAAAEHDGQDGGSGPDRSGAPTHDQGAEGAWWLNVRCPTYKDMQEISKLFPLHPLTVEDVLQQDPREKVDVFDKLGYYFVVIRAIDERYFRYTGSSGKHPDGSPRLDGDRGTSGSARKPAQPGAGKRTSNEGSEATAAGSASPKEKPSPEERGETERSGQPSFEMTGLAEKRQDTTYPDEQRTAADGLAQGAGGRAWQGDGGGVTTAMTRKAHVEIVEGVGGREGLEGVSVGANNLYLIVFAHGVISFSFDDVSKHTDRVMRRLLEITQPVELTADWIAHGLYDSVVDAFFPLLSFVQAEIVEIEAITTEPTVASWAQKKGTSLAPKRRRQRALMGTNPEGRLISVEPVLGNSSSASISGSSSSNGKSAGGIGGSPDMEKAMPPTMPSERPPDMLETRRLKTLVVLRLFPFIRLPEALLDHLPWFLVKRRQQVTIARLPTWEFQDALEEEMRKTAAEIDEAGGTVFDTQAAADQSSMLHRIADTRKIVTGLSRLLGPKNDAVKGLRKRLADLQQLQRMEERSSRRGHPHPGREVGAGSRTLMARTEVSMYMSDVHDHILTMLNQLGAGEGRLSEIHFSYLSRIDNENRKFRQGTDGVILVLATVTVAVLCMQFTTSLFSINVKVPHNRRDTPGGPYWWYMGIVLFLCCIPPSVYSYVRFLYRQSKRKLANKKAAR
ncbi:uncharacterized protein PFL1_00539 [Pseudozyma flocculosa PF-1]|uniref:Related to MNR2 - Manganese resistance protein n=1 Tax=Pseudozyma flocculosa TaxID=84751 RepID=A0A5C3ET44_9BASI|nr:uncharacterized protein PFL1_00539 [Pseudozyma flocculosa PF-1]EPQ32343.1 hypothetical protein PFL1_00539 [Pseudozyma flocculosa PF-1]SPO34696.1 related to MNR2 - Manganese resistance protein [Pseudozyma flocculosa]